MLTPGHLAAVSFFNVLLFNAFLRSFETGIFVSSVENSAIIALTDGSLHVLALGADAHLLPHEPLSLSTTLTAAMRQVNAENERYDPAGPVSKAQLFKTYAVAALPSGELSWFYECGPSLIQPILGH